MELVLAGLAECFWILHVELAPNLGNPGSKNQTEML